MNFVGYDSTENFYRFTSEEEEIVKYTCWTIRNLKGMETMFLMNTIIRIGSLMKVGYGAGESNNKLYRFSVLYRNIIY